MTGSFDILYYKPARWAEASNNLHIYSVKVSGARKESILGKVGAPLMAAAFPLRAMPHTNSSLFGLVGTSLVAAAIAFQLRALPETNSSLLDIVGASLVAAGFCLHAMPHTNSSLFGLVGASLLAAAFFLFLLYQLTSNSPWSRAAKMTNVTVQDCQSNSILINSNFMSCFSILHNQILLSLINKLVIGLWERYCPLRVLVDKSQELFNE